MLKAESNFDPTLSDPGKDEYGIARWTPRLLRWWIRGDGQPVKSMPKPPLSVPDSITALGHYLCYIEPQLTPGLPGDKRVLIAAAYRTSYKRVNAARGVPPEYRDYCTRLAHHLKEYTPPGSW